MRFTKVVEKVTPKELKPFVVRVFRLFRPLWYIGNNVSCPVCGRNFQKFAPAGAPVRANAQCPRCGSRERYRLLWLYLKDKTNFFTDRLKVLDVAPMYFLESKYKKLKNLDYTSADIDPRKAMIQMDISNISMPDNEYDCIICSHVLEHVTEDIKAMRELFRILRPGGWAILQVPIDPNLEKTFEDSSITSPKGRERLFGQHDHVRMYGLDYKDRLESVGFQVRVDDYVSELAKESVKKYGLLEEENVYFCTKPKD